jgi:1-phosphatidylinositol-4-phosphate 5-kinase
MALAAHQNHDYFSHQYMVKPATPEEQQHAQQQNVFSAASNEKPRSVLLNPSPNTPSSLEYPRESTTVDFSSAGPKRHSTSFNLAPASSFKNKTNKQKLVRNHTTGHVLTEPEVSEDFAKELSARQKAFRRLSRRHPIKEEDEDRVLMGTRISEGHQNYILMYNMLTGIRIAVGRVSAKPDRPLVEQDFSAAHKLAFDV